MVMWWHIGWSSKNVKIKGMNETTSYWWASVRIPGFLALWRRLTDPKSKQYNGKVSWRIWQKDMQILILILEREKPREREKILYIYIFYTWATVAMVVVDTGEEERERERKRRWNKGTASNQEKPQKDHEISVTLISSADSFFLPKPHLIFFFFFISSSSSCCYHSSAFFSVLCL